MPPVISNFHVHGAALRALRIKSHMRLADLADRASIDLSYLSKLERGKNSNATREVVERLAAALEVPFEALVCMKRIGH